MGITEWVQYALSQHGFDPEKARESLHDLGGLNPPLSYYQECCAIAAKELWAELLSKVDMNRLAEHEYELMRQMGPLWQHLRPDDAQQVRQAAEYHWRTLHPRPFMGFKTKE